MSSTLEPIVKMTDTFDAGGNSIETKARKTQANKSLGNK